MRPVEVSPLRQRRNNVAARGQPALRDDLRRLNVLRNRAPTARKLRVTDTYPGLGARWRRLASSSWTTGSCVAVLWEQYLASP